jgi:ribosome maturation factor RimP
VNEEAIRMLLAPALADLGLEWYGVEQSPGRNGGVLRVYIDVEGRPVTIEDCERASREVSALLDVHAPIAGRYTLEVSSPGLDRPLFTPRQFASWLGHEARIQVSLPVDGRRRFHGAIRSADEDGVTIEQDGRPVRLVFTNIDHARLVPDYETAQPARGRGRPARQARKHPPRAGAR